MKRVFVVSAFMVLTFTAVAQKVREADYDGFKLVLQTDGATLGYSPESGVKVIYSDGYAFKDMNRNGSLDVYEDWRKESGDRAQDLADRMTIDQIECHSFIHRISIYPALQHNIRT